MLQVQVQEQIQKLHFNELVKAIGGDGVISGLEVTAAGGMDLNVSAGEAIISGTRVSFAATTVTIPAADSLYPRKDIVIAKDDGSIAVVQGTPDSPLPGDRTGVFTVTPRPPDPPSGSIILAEIWVPAGATEIASGDVTDRRIFVAPSEHVAGKIYADQIAEKTAGVGITLLNVSKHQGGIQTDTISELTGGAKVSFPSGLKTDTVEEYTSGAKVSFPQGIKTDAIEEKTSGAGINLGDGALYVDQANKRVGIRTTSPKYSLHIAGSGAGFIPLLIEVDAGFPRPRLDAYGDYGYYRAILDFRRARGAKSSPSSVASGDYLGSIYFHGHDGEAFVDSAAIIGRADGAPSSGLVPGRIELLTRGSDGLNARMVIKSDGKVGINTTSPSDTLHVHGNARIAGDGSPRLLIMTSAPLSETTSPRIQFVGGSGSWFWIDNIGTALRFSSGGTPGANPMVLTSDGKVGIGTTTPEQTLHVGGSSPTLKLGGSAAAGSLLIDKPDTSLADIVWQTGGVNRWILRITEESDGGNLRFISRNDDGSYKRDLLTLDRGNDRIGIRKTNPYRVFHVYGDGAVYVARFEDGGSMVFELWAGGDAAFNFYQGRAAADNKLWSFTVRREDDGTGFFDIRLIPDDYNWGAAQQVLRIHRNGTTPEKIDFADIDLVPMTDNTGRIGTESQRWSLVRAVTVTQGDIGFGPEDQPCPICGKRFEVGDLVVLKVHKVLENGEFRARPVHLKCAR